MIKWVQIDALGAVVGGFGGSVQALRKHLTTGIADVAVITTMQDESVYLCAPVKFVKCRDVVTLKTPWGVWRYINRY